MEASCAFQQKWGCALCPDVSTLASSSERTSFQKSCDLFRCNFTNLSLCASELKAISALMLQTIFFFYCWICMMSERGDILKMGFSSTHWWSVGAMQCLHAYIFILQLLPKRKPSDYMQKFCPLNTINRIGAKGI